MKISILLTGHGRWSEGMISTHNLVIGEDPNVEFLNFNTGNDSLEDYHNAFSEKINKLSQNSEEVWVLTDLVGGYPFQTAVMKTQQHSNLRVFGGINIPFLLTLTSEKDSIDNDCSQFINDLLNDTREALGYFDPTPSQESEERDDLDGI